MNATGRPLQTPCQWCGEAITQPPTGRLRRYCGRSHRQRAYEARTAGRRRQADVDAGAGAGAGAVTLQPAERLVERVVTAPYPRRASGWEAALDELGAQLADGRLPAWHAARLQAALSRVSRQLQIRIDDGLPRPSREELAVEPLPPYLDASFAGERLAVIDERIRGAGGALSTTLQRLAADVRLDVDELREAVLDFERLGLMEACRMGCVVAVDELAVYARFELRAT